MTKTCEVNAPCIQTESVAVMKERFRFTDKQIEVMLKNLDKFMEKTDKSLENLLDILEKYYAKKSDCEAHGTRLDKLDKIVWSVAWLVMLSVGGALLSKVIM